MLKECTPFIRTFILLFMEQFMRILVILNVLLYVPALTLAFHRGQGVKIYLVYMAIQAILLLMQVNKVGFSGKGDAAGNGMEAGLLFVLYFAIQMVVFIVLIVTFIRKSL
ncbi:MAG TPA: hypothetical protein VGD40_11900 [Chryseosolibacter sp.]